MHFLKQIGKDCAEGGQNKSQLRSESHGLSSKAVPCPSPLPVAFPNNVVVFLFYFVLVTVVQSCES